MGYAAIRRERKGGIDSTARDDFEARLPGVFYLDPADPRGLEAHLRRLGWLAAGEPVAGAARAGEGNMNCTVRVTTPARTLILKQARPWVEKYPAIAAPWSRTAVEARFYQTVAAAEAVAGRMPRFLGFDPESNLLALEDLGAARDLTSLYGGERLDGGELGELATYLAALHRAFAGRQRDPVLLNRAMRELNHEHLFVVPLSAELGPDLDSITPGLAAAAAPLRADVRFAAEVRRLGSLYLDDGTALVHGDYFPGSWVRTAGGIRVIDPEFCFFGPPELDLGVMIAHLQMAHPGERWATPVLDAYAGGNLDARLALQFAGVEIMRRLIGVAQLPLTRSLDEKAALLALARDLVLGT